LKKKNEGNKVGEESGGTTKLKTHKDSIYIGKGSDITIYENALQ